MSKDCNKKLQHCSVAENYNTAQHYGHVTTIKGNNRYTTTINSHRINGNRGELSKKQILNILLFFIFNENAGK